MQPPFFKAKTFEEQYSQIPGIILLQRIAMNGVAKTRFPVIKQNSQSIVIEETMNVNDVKVPAFNKPSNPNHFLEGFSFAGSTNGFPFDVWH